MSIIISQRHFAALARPLRALSAAALVAALLQGHAAWAAAGLQASPARSTDGVTQLSWDLDGQAAQLQRARDPQFGDATVIYSGTDSASLRSGLADGTYYYRVRALPPAGTPDAWSPAVAVEVAHHSARRAWGIFATGAVVFLATLGLILLGGRRESRDD
jgi:hypothetical protein